jgi:hypothetical protein
LSSQGLNLGSLGLAQGLGESLPSLDTPFSQIGQQILSNYQNNLFPSDITGGAIKNAVSNAAGSAAKAAASSFFTSDTVAIILGVLFIGVGLYSFKQTQIVIQGAGSIAKAGAKVAAA